MDSLFMGMEIYARNIVEFMQDGNEDAALRTFETAAASHESGKKLAYQVLQEYAWFVDKFIDNGELRGAQAVAGRANDFAEKYIPDKKFVSDYRAYITIKLALGYMALSQQQEKNGFDLYPKQNNEEGLRLMREAYAYTSRAI